jgi:RyR domain
MGLTHEDIARVAHEANRAYQVATGDPEPSLCWDEAPQWQRASAIEGVRTALTGATPGQSHESWLAHKKADGWTYGPLKDETARTHPCMVPYDALPESQKLKDHLFTGVVRALAPAAAA